MGVLSRIVFNPYISGPLLFLVTRNSSAVQETLHRYLSEQNIILVTKWLKYLLGLGILSRVNRMLSRRADDKWVRGNDRKAWNWPNEVVVVTGGSNGIGARVSEILAKKGVKVAVLDVQPLGAELSDLHNVKYYHCDLRSRESIAKAAEAVRSDFGAPSVLLNNAGIGNAHNILEATPESLHAMFEINIISHWFTIQEFVPDMVTKRKGHVLSVASMGSFVAPAGMVDYSATKVGLIALHEGLNQELKHRYMCPQIKTTIIHPSWVKTRLVGPLENDLKKAGAPVLEIDQVAGRIVKQIEDGRSGQLIIPGSQTAGTIIRALPNWTQELIRDGTKSFVLEKGSSLGV